MTYPTKEEIIKLRKDCKLTQVQAAQLIYRKMRAWQHWEQGTRKMDPAYWELFQLKTRCLLGTDAVGRSLELRNRIDVKQDHDDE